MNYVGIDHHHQYSHITWLDEKGEVVKSGRVANLRRELEEFLQGARDVRAVIEAGRSSYTMVDVLADWKCPYRAHGKCPYRDSGKST
jgi:transposase